MKKRAKHLKPSKSDDFLERLRNDSSMIEYLTKLRMMNPAAERSQSLNPLRREGRFVRLAHAREEFTAPLLTKGKSVGRERTKSNRRKKPKNPS